MLLSLRKLIQLGLCETAITESGVRELRRGLPRCEIHYSPRLWPARSNVGGADGTLPPLATPAPIDITVSPVVTPQGPPEGRDMW